jgi:(1->4)-alpha-D-glucan 1-alpha-D-glucosylmutase
VLSELTQDWAGAVTRWRAMTGADRPPVLDANTEYLLWQTLVGTWPIDADRLAAYLEKATREAKRRTTWTEPDPEYDDAVRTFAAQVLADPQVTTEVAAFVERLAPAWRANVLAQKLLALTVPGVPDVYQGCELTDLSLVDPDNRRPVDFAARREALARLDAGQAPADLDEEKLLVTSRALRLRRDRPGWFTGEDAVHEPLAVTTPHVVAVGRGDASGTHVVALVTRLAAGLERAGGWAHHEVALPPGRWRDLLTGTVLDASATGPGGHPRVADLLDGLPVALLVRDET